MEKTYKMVEHFTEVETTEEHNGYFCSVGEALTVVILGSLCGLKNVSQIHQWASNARIKVFLMDYFGIMDIPCYYWMLQLLKLVKPASLNECFMNWVQSLCGTLEGHTISFDGKTIRSTGKMAKHPSAMHIVSAQIAGLGLTLAQQTTSEKSNEIPAMRELLAMLKIEGCMIVADALHCQKETAKSIVQKKADYLLNVKDNQSELKQEIEDYVKNAPLRQEMDTAETLEKNRGRIERRTAYTMNDIEWVHGKEHWANLACIGAIHRQVTTKTRTSDEWHYYISSRKLTADELLAHARMEWSVETMHWLLDVHFNEDDCRIEDKTVQQNLNIVRKIALNSIKHYKNIGGNKRPISKIMMDCILEPLFLLNILLCLEN